MSRPLSLLIVAGEISGDMHAARLVEALKQRHPDLQCYGIGGDALRAAGMEILFDTRPMAVMGLTEVLKRLPFFMKVFFSLLRVARERRPDAVILVDYPGFNMRFAARAHALGLKVIYYICPQVWAWNRARIPRMAEIVDRLIAIFPFEPQVFSGTRLKVDFVGHPLVDELQEEMHRPLPDLPWEGSPRLALLPGSRRHEVERLLPAMLSTIRLISKQKPDASVIIAAPSQDIGDIGLSVAKREGGLPARCQLVVGQTRSVLRSAHAALVASGTATLESGLLGCPTVIAYSVSPLTYWLGRILVKIDHIGIMNIVAGKRLCPEFLQDEVTPMALAAALLPLLDDTPERRTMVEQLAEAAALLGGQGAVERAAGVILNELGV